MQIDVSVSSDVFGMAAELKRLGMNISDMHTDGLIRGDIHWWNLSKVKRCRGVAKVSRADRRLLCNGPLPDG